jgi:hypothetical protein
MSGPKQQPASHEVDDAAAAFHKLENFTRRILAVPKKAINRKPAPPKTKKKRTVN